MTSGRRLDLLWHLAHDALIEFAGRRLLDLRVVLARPSIRHLRRWWPPVKANSPIIDYQNAETGKSYWHKAA